LLTDHQHFEELCALIASGQASEDHQLEWQEHAQECAECRSLRRDFEQTARAIVVSDNKRAPRYNVPAGMTERFVAHARSAGVPLIRNEAEKRPQVRSFSRLAFNTAAAAALIALIAFFFWMLRTNRADFPLFKQFHGSNSPLQTSPAVDSVGQSALLQENLRLREQLRDAQTQSHFLATKIASDREALMLADSRRSELSSRLGVLEAANGDLEKGLTDQLGQTARLKGDLDRLRSAREAGEMALQVEEADLNILHEKVATLTTELQEREQLSTEAKDAMDLIGARNLHVVDVNDADENGKRQRPFGRVYYAEDLKKLRFYAYDLADTRKANAKIHFYAWGEKLGESRPVKTLGVLHADPRRKGLWKLEFDDPNVLAEIDSVFVTAESEKRPIKQPSGKKILYAFWGDKPNHP
jgi:hypothetical protein